MESIEEAIVREIWEYLSQGADLAEGIVDEDREGEQRIRAAMLAIVRKHGYSTEKEGG